MSGIHELFSHWLLSFYKDSKKGCNTHVIFLMVVKLFHLKVWAFPCEINSCIVHVNPLQTHICIHVELVQTTIDIEYGCMNSCEYVYILYVFWILNSMIVFVSISCILNFVTMAIVRKGGTISCHNGSMLSCCLL